MTTPLPGGRPHKLTVKVTAAELAQAEVLARREACTLSEVLRRALHAYAGPTTTVGVKRVVMLRREARP